MGVILVRESENMCIDCIQHINNECVLGLKPEVIEKTSVGDISRCDEYYTEIMLENE